MQVDNAKLLRAQQHRQAFRAVRQTLRARFGSVINDMIVAGRNNLAAAIRSICAAQFNRRSSVVSGVRGDTRSSRYGMTHVARVNVGHRDIAAAIICGLATHAQRRRLHLATFKDVRSMVSPPFVLSDIMHAGNSRLPCPIGTLTGPSPLHAVGINRRAGERGPLVLPAEVFVLYADEEHWICFTEWWRRPFVIHKFSKHWVDQFEGPVTDRSRHSLRNGVCKAYFSTRTVGGAHTVLLEFSTRAEGILTLPRDAADRVAMIRCLEK